MRYTFLCCSLILSMPVLQAQERVSVDVCVYGITSGGVIAAYTASRLGKTVVMVGPDSTPGGLSSGGLGYTDIGNKSAITGLSRDFYRRIGSHYGKTEQWIFEPHVAENVFQDYIKEAHLRVFYRQSLVTVFKKTTRIKEIYTVSQGSGTEKTGLIISAKQYIDCSYEGDLMASAGVSYVTGREENLRYHELHNGVQLLSKHQFPEGIDPYRIEGDSQSGLVWGVTETSLMAQGSGDKKMQAYNFRLCLTDSTENKIELQKPVDYDPAHYELLIRYIKKANPGRLEEGILNFNLLPGRKTDINNNGPFSTDMIGMNYDYPNGETKTRDKIFQQHKEYTIGLLYFLGHDARVPDHLRNEMLRWGFPKDEYTGSDHWTPQLYLRETRRMTGEYVMTENNCAGKIKITDGIGMAAYTMDSHNCQRLVVNGMVKNEGDVQIGGFPPYPISYSAILPKRSECTNLLVPVCLSASHIAYGSIRMEPVFMVLGQSAAEAACLAIDSEIIIQKVPVKKIQKALLQDPLVQHSMVQSTSHL